MIQLIEVAPLHVEADIDARELGQIGDGSVQLQAGEPHQRLYLQWKAAFNILAELQHPTGSSIGRHLLSFPLTCGLELERQFLGRFGCNGKLHIDICILCRINVAQRSLVNQQRTDVRHCARIRRIARQRPGAAPVTFSLQTQLRILQKNARYLHLAEQQRPHMNIELCGGGL